MTQQDQQNPADQELTWGGKQPERTSRWSGKKTAAAVAIAVVVAGAGGFAVYAASSSAGTSTPQGMGGGPGGGMRGGFGGGVMDALHGEFTISDGSNGYKTAIMQTGQVTAISATSLTAKSTDGYTKVYTIDADTAFGTGSVSDIKSGDTVTVVATPSGDNATADSVMDRSQMPQGGPGQGGVPRQGTGGS